MIEVRDLSLHLDVNGTLMTNDQITMDQIMTKVQCTKFQTSSLLGIATSV